MLIQMGRYFCRLCSSHTKNLKINEKLHFCGAFHLIETNSWCFENRNEVTWYLISCHMYPNLMYELQFLQWI